MKPLKNRVLKDKKNNLVDGSIEVTSTNIKLCKIPIQLHTGDTIWFSTPEKQQEFFDKYTIHEFESCTYVRIEEGFTQLPINVENLRKDVNYICIQNKGFSDKWYYCNILSIAWVNMNVSKINFAIDTLQTFRFDMVFNQPSHIIKRHFSYANDGEYIINGLPDISFDVGSMLYTIETGMTYYETRENNTTKYVLNTITNDNDGCYIINTSQPFKGTDGTEIDSAEMLSSIIDTFNYYYGDSQYNSTPVRRDTQYNYGMMGCVYVMDNQCMLYCIQNKIFTNEKNNGIIQHISYLPLTWEYCVRSDANNLADRLVGAGHGRMTSLYNMITANNLYIFFGFNVFNYYANALNIELDDDDYLFRLQSGSVSIYDDILERRKNAIIQYLMRPYFTRFTINDHANNVIDYDIRYMYNGKLDDSETSFIYKDSYFNKDVTIKGLRLNIITLLATSPQPVINWMLNDYNIGDNNRYHLQCTREDRETFGIISGTNAIVNNDMWLKIIPQLYLPVVNDYYSMFLMANKYQLSAQRNNINRNYRTALANANTTLDASLNNAYLNYKGNVASAKALQANASIQYGASVQIANNNYNNAINISQNNLSNAMFALENEKWRAQGVNAIKNKSDDSSQLMAWNNVNLNPWGAFGFTGLMGDDITRAMNNSINTLNLNTEYEVGVNKAFTANDNAQLNATNAYNNALIQASANANMLRNTANAQMTMAYNAYKGQQGILNANYQNEIRNAKTVQQNALDMLNASIRDAQNVADSMTEQYQGDNTQFFTNTISPIYTVGCVKPEYMKRIINTFKYYGFTCNEFNMIDKVIEKWDVGGYIQTSNCMVTGSIPYQWILDICEVFNSGIRLWKDEENFLNFSGILNQ